MGDMQIDVSLFPDGRAYSLQNNTISSWAWNAVTEDFTINAMSLPLSEFLSEKKGIIDPYKGQEDFSNKKIRVLQGPIFSSDPLRMLRAFRFAATLEFNQI